VLNPQYLNPLFDTSAGNIMLVACGLWMLTGILVMRKMINFEI
jgi:tight adherence protein B